MSFVAIPDPRTGGVQGSVINTATGNTVYYGFNFNSVASSMNQQFFGSQPKPPSYYSGNIHSDFDETEHLSSEISNLQSELEQMQHRQEQAQSTNDYATEIMDTAVSAGLEHQRWVEQQQESLLDYYKQRIDRPVGDAGNLMEAGTAELMRAQKSAMHTVTSSLAARGLLGSSAAESAYAKIAGETATKIGSLAADTQKQLIQTQVARESAYLQAMNQLLSIPVLQGYAEIANAGANASLFAVPTGGF